MLLVLIVPLLIAKIKSRLGHARMGVVFDHVPEPTPAISNGITMPLGPIKYNNSTIPLP
jgi:hypothetical protein